MARAPTPPPFLSDETFSLRGPGRLRHRRHPRRPVLRQQAPRRRAARRSTRPPSGSRRTPAAIIVDWARDGHYPLFSTAEALSFLAWTLVVAFGLVTYRYPLRALGAFLLPVVALLVLASQLVSADPGKDPGSVTDGSGSWLFPVHVTLLLFGYASFFVAFSASVMYLWQERELRLKKFGAIFHRLPSLTTVDDVASTAASVGFTLLTLGIVTGVIWSRARSIRMFHNDPTEFFALLTWVVYLALLHFRVQWRGRKAAWLGVGGFTLVLCTFVGAVALGGFHVFR